MINDITELGILITILGGLITSVVTYLRSRSDIKNQDARSISDIGIAEIGSNLAAAKDINSMAIGLITMYKAETDEARAEADEAEQEKIECLKKYRKLLRKIVVEINEVIDFHAGQYHTSPICQQCGAYPQVNSMLLKIIKNLENGNGGGNATK